MQYKFSASLEHQHTISCRNWMCARLRGCGYFRAGCRFSWKFCFRVAGMSGPNSCRGHSGKTVDIDNIYHRILVSFVILVSFWCRFFLLLTNQKTSVSQATIFLEAMTLAVSVPSTNTSSQSQDTRNRLDSSCSICPLTRLPKTPQDSHDYSFQTPPSDVCAQGGQTAICAAP